MTRNDIKQNIILFLIAILVWGLFLCRGQISLTSGFTEVSDKMDGVSMNFNSGYSFADKYSNLGFHLGGSLIRAKDYNYTQIHIGPIYRFEGKNGYWDFGASPLISFTDKAQEIKAILRSSKAFKIGWNKHLLLDFNHVIGLRQTNISLGVSFGLWRSI